MKHLRLCFLANAASVHSYRWVTYFADRGHAVDWLSHAALPFPHHHSVHFHRLPAAGGRAGQVVAGAFTVRRLLRDIRPDVLHVHYAGVNGVIGWLSGFHPLVLTAWGSDLLMAGRRTLVGTLVQSSLRDADLVTCDAQHMADRITGIGVHPDRVRIVYFGTDTARFRPADRDEALAATLGIEGRPTIISLRSLAPVYDVTTAVRAAPDVLRAHPTATFVVCGGGPDADRVKDLASSLGVSDSFRFLGPIPNEELPRYLNLADVYVSTSLSDAGLAASTAEAMACEVPVVVTNSGENRLWVQDALNGFIVPCGSSSLLAERIAALLADEAMRRMLGRAGRETIAERNSYEVEMARMEELYRELVIRQGPAPASRS